MCVQCRQVVRYSLADGARPWEAVGDDLDEAIAARERKQAYFEAVDANVPVVQDQDEAGRAKSRTLSTSGSPSFNCFKLFFKVLQWAEVLIAQFAVRSHDLFGNRD